MNLLENMRVVREVARLEGFAAAGRALNLSPPSVSRIVAETEAELGVRLFARSTRHVAPTEEGALFLRRADAVLDGVETLKVELTEREAKPVGRLRVSSVVAFGTEVLPGALARFASRYPGIEVELEVSNRRVDLVEEHVDVAIRIGSAEGLEDSALIARRIFEQRLIFVATPGFLDRHGRPGDLAALARLPLVRFITGRFGVSHRLVGPEGRAAEFALPGRLVMDSPIAARNAVFSGEVVGLVADYLVRDALAAGAVERVLAPWATRPQPVFAVHAHRELMPARLRVFLEFLAGAFGDAGD